MSLAARICSIKCGGMSPATARLSLLSAHQAVNLAFSPPGHAVFVPDFFCIPRGRLHEDHGEVFFGVLSSKRAFVNLILDGHDARKEAAAIVVVVVLFL